MNRKLKLITGIILGTVMFCGCSSNNKENDADVADIIVETRNNYEENISFSEAVEGNFHNYAVHKETYNFKNDKSSSVSISYPVVTMDNKELADKVNENIKKAAFSNYDEGFVSGEYNANISLDYTLVNTSEDTLSVYFKGEGIKGSIERGLSLSLKDGNILDAKSFNISKEDIEDLVKCRLIGTTNPDLIKSLKEKDRDVSEYLYNTYEKYNDEVYNFFVDDNNIYLVTTVAPVEGYYITLKISYKFK